MSHDVIELETGGFDTLTFGSAYSPTVNLQTDASGANKDVAIENDRIVERRYQYYRNLYGADYHRYCTPMRRSMALAVATLWSAVAAAIRWSWTMRQT